MVGADLANLVNEAALLAAKRSHPVVNQQDFTDALERIVLGAARSVVISDEDRRRTAYHEAGHAIVGMLTPGADPVRKVSIIPRGQALGVTFSAPDADRFNFDERHLHAQIKVALGGRCAEEIVFGDLTTGAESDIQHLTRIARFMVGRWGMSSAIGPIAVLPSEATSMLLPGVSETSQKTQELVDEEVHRIVGRPTARCSRCCASTARSSTTSSPRCSSTRRSIRPTPTPRSAWRASAAGAGAGGCARHDTRAEPVTDQTRRSPTTRRSRVRLSRRGASSGRAPHGTRRRAS